MYHDTLIASHSQCTLTQTMRDLMALSRERLLRSPGDALQGRVLTLYRPGQVQSGFFHVGASEMERNEVGRVTICFIVTPSSIAFQGQG